MKTYIVLGILFLSMNAYVNSHIAQEEMDDDSPSDGIEEVTNPDEEKEVYCKVFFNKESVNEILHIRARDIKKISA